MSKARVSKLRPHALLRDEVRELVEALVETGALLAVVRADPAERSDHVGPGKAAEEPRVFFLARLIQKLYYWAW